MNLSTETSIFYKVQCNSFNHKMVQTSNKHSSAKKNNDKGHKQKEEGHKIKKNNITKQNNLNKRNNNI